MSRSRSPRAFPRALRLCLLPSILSGCIFSPDPPIKTPPVSDLREPEPTSIEGAIQLYEFVWDNRRLDLYDLLLHDAFEYFPRQDDIADLVWMQGTSWGRTDELLMAAHMFDPEFLSETTNESIDSIEMELAMTDERVTPEGVEVTVDADIRVLWAASSGAFSNVRFVFLVVPNPDEPGRFRIRRQDELPEFN